MDVLILEVRVSASFDEHLHNFVGFVVVSDEDTKVEAGLAALHLQFVDYVVGVLIEVLLDLLHGTNLT